MTRSARFARRLSPSIAALLFSVGSVGLSGKAAAEEPVRHTVKANETCAAIAQHYYGDSRLVDVIHKANPVLAAKPPPHSLTQGMVLIIPPKPASTAAPDAELTAVRNRVELLTPESRQGKINDPLYRGNRVNTQEASAADVTFRDETQVKLGERTLIVILGDARSAAAKPGEMQTTLVTGNLRAWMSGSKKATGTAIATDAAGVRIINGEAKVSADAKKATRLAVYKGNSTIAARGKKQEVARGFGSKANLGQAPTPPRALPPAPLWISPADVVLLAQESGDPPAFVGEYAEGATGPGGTGPSVAHFRVQVARDEAFRDVVTDVEVPKTTVRLEGKAPGPGRYFIRVSAVDDDRFEGPFGRTARVLVVGAKKTVLGNRRRVEIEPADAFCVRVGNVPLTRLRGPIEAPAGEAIRVRCAPSETDPTALFSFD